ncbi:hypothetical protein D3C84_798670 [compost metagenome]
MRPGVNGTVIVCPAFFAACSTPAQPARTIRSAREIFLPPALNSCWIPSSFASTLASWSGWLACQNFCGARRRRPPLAPPRLSEPRKVDAAAHAVETSCETDRPEASSLLFSAATSLSLTSG